MIQEINVEIQINKNGQIPKKQLSKKDKKKNKVRGFMFHNFKAYYNATVTKPVHWH